MHHALRKYQPLAPAVPRDVQDALGRICDRNKDLEAENEELRQRLQKHSLPGPPNGAVFTTISSGPPIHSEVNKRLMISALVVLVLVITAALGRALGEKA